MTGETDPRTPDRTSRHEPADPTREPTHDTADGGAEIRGPHARFRAHVPARPSFRCRGCGAPWPCQPARLSLLLAYRNDRVGLMIYLACQLHRALHDLPGVDPVDLSTRFLGWAPRDPP
ncbi:hypothetical protein [Plantactinospora sp. CA-290183]|uniref:hypothetical protein n=1 Tax=Plantactinospora sp. CA-290183 TaxID=3240006 RepID=UPI003D8A4BBE